MNSKTAALESTSRMTLREVLSHLGYTTQARRHEGKHILQGGEVVFSGTAGDVWSWLRESGQVAS